MDKPIQVGKKNAESTGFRKYHAKSQGSCQSQALLVSVRGPEFRSQYMAGRPMAAYDVST